MSNENMEFDSPSEEVIQSEMPTELEEDAVMAEGLEGEFDEPAEDADEDAALAAQASLVAVDESLVQLADAIEGQLLQQSAAATGAMAMSAEAFEGIGNIQGIGFGLSEDDPTATLEPGAAHLNIYVAEPTSIEQIKAVMVDSMGIQAASSDNLPINVIVFRLD